jgi:hypothetical protein
MKITLIRTGGLLPIIKKAEGEVNLNEAEMQLLLETIKTSDDAGEARDKTGYLINYNAETLPINWEKIPAEHMKTFEVLKDNLAIVKK